MGTYTRLGTCLLVSELARDPLGVLHRAVAAAGGRFERHLLVRTFSKELLQAGMNTRLAEADRVESLLGDAKAFGSGFRTESGVSPHVVCDYVPGRSLAQLISKAKQEQIPFGVEHALSVIQGVAQGIVQMQAKGVSHGLLSPHSVWVAFEGTTQIVDTPFAALAKSMLAQAPSAGHRLAPYLQGPDSDALQKDLFALGALFYELLTFECLPVGSDLQALLDQATLKAAQEDSPLPAELRSFLGRLLLGIQPFGSLEAFSTELEHILYGGEHNPTTFDMAFLMHTLFREEHDRDAAAMKAEQGDNYLADAAVAETLGGEVPGGDSAAGLAEAQSKQKRSNVLIGGGLVAVVVLGLGYLLLGRHRTDPAIQRQLEELRTLKAQFEQQKADLEAKAKAEGEKAVLLQKQLTDTRSAEEKAKLQKQIKESEQRSLELERQQKAAEQRLVEQRQKEQRLPEQKQTIEVKPAPLPLPETPKTQPVPEQPKALAAPTAAAAQPAPALAPVYETARIVKQVPPSYPQRAIQMRWGINQDQRVSLKVFVGEQGQALKVSVIEGVAGSYGFDEAAIQAANQSTFSPATRDGKPVRGWTPEIVYKFLKRN
jgi:TonB family protein